MARFQFQAVNNKGDRVEGEIDAKDQAAVIEQLRRREQMPLSIHPAGTGSISRQQSGGLIDLLNQPLWQSGGLKKRDVGIMTRELATLLEAGLTVDQSLNFLIEVTSSKVQRQVFNDLLERVQSGSSLADALADHQTSFSPAYISLVRAGEAGNALGSVLGRLALYMERSEQLSQQVKSALVYPIMLLIMAAASVAILLIVVLPQFTPMFETAGTDLPWLTQAVVTLGEMAQAYWWLALIMVVVGVLGIGNRLRHPPSRAVIDRWLLSLPLIGDLIAKVDTAGLARTVGTLLANGVALPHALSIAKDTMGNAVLRDVVNTTLSSVKEGKGVSGSLGRSEVFPPLAIHLIAVGERSGQLETMLMKVADIFDQEVKHAIEKLMTLLVPLLTIGVGVVIALIIGAILSAILAAYQLPI